MKTALVDGQEVTVGDVVNFKCDIEQSGKIVEIKQSYTGKALVLESISPSGFHGDYIGGETITTELARDCWLEG